MSKLRKLMILLKKKNNNNKNNTNNYIDYFLGIPKEFLSDSMRYYLTFEEVDKKLECIMTNIVKSCQDAATEYGFGNNYVAGAHIGAFTKLAEAVKAQGVV